jgi:Adenosine deaminase z-alpha domain
MPSSLEEAIAAYLQSHPGTKASSIARHLSVPRRDVNSCLYTKRSRFRSEGSDPPIWFLLDKHSKVHAPQLTVVKTADEVVDSMSITEMRRQSARLVLTAIRENYPFVFNFQDWIVRVQIVSRSVNDPMVEAHRISKSDLIVEVNAHFVNPEVRESSSGLHIHVMHCVADVLTQFLLEKVPAPGLHDVLDVKSGILFSLMLEGSDHGE